MLFGTFVLFGFEYFGAFFLSLSKVTVSLNTRGCQTKEKKSGEGREGERARKMQRTKG